MYFGSVKFFKHIILSISGFILLIMIALTVTFAVLYNNERNNAVQVNAKYNELLNTGERLNIPQGSDFNEIYSELIKHGYSAEDIIKYLSENEPDAIKEFYSNNIISNTITPGYTELYPDLYADKPSEFVKKEKTVYLTFDDGPSENTLLIMSILDKYNIKATFFMSGSETEQGMEIMKKVADSGHSIGVHSFSHDYNEIYHSTESYLEDFYNTYSLIYNATGVKPTIFRFAGGSINNYNRFVYKEIIGEMTRRGFTYYDWNVSGEDAKKDATWTSIYNSVLKGIEGKDTAIVLLHDSKDKGRTVLVVEDLIQSLLEDEYSFDKITNDVEPYTFSYLT